MLSVKHFLIVNYLIFNILQKADTVMLLSFSVIIAIY